MAERPQIKKYTGRGGARPNSGRKPYTTRPTRHTTVHLPEELIDEIEIHSQDEGKSRSHLIYELLERAMKERRRKRKLGKQGAKMRPKQGATLKCARKK